MAATDTTVRVMSNDEVVDALQKWVDTNIPKYGYEFVNLLDEHALQATRRIGRWARVTPRNEDMYAAFVAGTASAKDVADLSRHLSEAHEAFELFAQVIAVRFFPEATVITDDIRQTAHGYLAHL